MKLIFYGILIYLLYKLIFDFVIPVSRATRQIKSKIREAQAEQQRQFQQQQQYQRQQDQARQQQQQFSQRNTPGNDSEYIDYEEVK